MADNIDVTPGTGKTVASDDVGGIQYQRVKLTIGADGVNDGDISSSNPIPITASALPLPTGAATQTTLAALNTKVTAVDTGNVVLAAGTASVGKVVPEGSASGVGFSTDRRTAQSNTAVAIKASAGRVYGWHFYNPNTADAFIHFYDVAQGSVTVGSTTPKISLWIPAGGAIDDFSSAIPITFSTAITMAASTTITGGTAPSTGLLAVSYFI